MSEVIKKCVLVAPGHNLPAEFNPKKAEALDVQKVRLLAAGVLELGYCECPKEMRFMPKSPWSNIMRCPHLVLTHSEELLNAVRDGRVKSLVIKEMQYAFGVLVWSVDLRAHFWLRKLESPKLVNDYQVIFLHFQQQKQPEFPKKRSKEKFFIDTAPQRFRRFILDRLHKNPIRFYNLFHNASTTFEIEENSPCCFIDVGKN